MKSIFNYVTVITSVLLVTSILLQARGSSLGAGFGGDTSFYRSKRGAEKFLYNATIVLGVILVLSVSLSILSKT